MYTRLLWNDRSYRWSFTKLTFLIGVWTQNPTHSVIAEFFTTWIADNEVMLFFWEKRSHIINYRTQFDATWTSHSVLNENVGALTNLIANWIPLWTFGNSFSSVHNGAFNLQSFNGFEIRNTSLCKTIKRRQHNQITNCPSFISVYHKLNDIDVQTLPQQSSKWGNYSVRNCTY